MVHKVNDFWFNEKVAGITTSHKIQFDALKNEYRITRSWEFETDWYTVNFLY